MVKLNNDERSKILNKTAVRATKKRMGILHKVKDVEKSKREEFINLNTIKTLMLVVRGIYTGGGMNNDMLTRNGKLEKRMDLTSFTRTALDVDGLETDKIVARYTIIERPNTELENDERYITRNFKFLAFTSAPKLWCKNVGESGHPFYYFDVELIKNIACYAHQCINTAVHTYNNNIEDPGILPYDSEKQYPVPNELFLPAVLNTLATFLITDYLQDLSTSEEEDEDGDEYFELKEFINLACSIVPEGSDRLELLWCSPEEKILDRMPGDLRVRKRVKFNIGVRGEFQEGMVLKGNVATYVVDAGSESLKLWIRDGRVAQICWINAIHEIYHDFKMNCLDEGCATRKKEIKLEKE